MSIPPRDRDDAPAEFTKFATALEAAGVERSLLEATLRGAGGTVAPNAVEAHTLWASAYRAHFPPLSALIAGTLVPFGSYPVLDYLASSCLDVAEGFERIARYFGLIRPECRFAIDGDGSAPSVTLLDERRGDDWFFDEWTIGVTVRGFRHTLPTFRPRAIQLRRPAPVDDASRRASVTAAAALGAELVFGAPDAAFVFDRATWSARLPSGDARLRATLERHADDLLDEQRSRGETTRSVRAVLAHELSAGEPTIQVVAKKLASSARTLQRQLAAEGTSYQEVLDALRAELAKRHLARGLGVTEVAFLLGYADGSAFARAYRRWYGCAPKEARREIGSPQG